MTLKSETMRLLSIRVFWLEKAFTVSLSSVFPSGSLRFSLGEEMSLVSQPSSVPSPTDAALPEGLHPVMVLAAPLPCLLPRKHLKGYL